MNATKCTCIKQVCNMSSISQLFYFCRTYVIDIKNDIIFIYLCLFFKIKCTKIKVILILLIAYYKLFIHVYGVTKPKICR